MDDCRIIELYQQGKKEEAFKEIVDKYSEQLYWHIRRFILCHEDTDDVLQDTFIKVWAALPGFRQEARLYTWIYKIATNEALNFLRKIKIKSILRLDSSENMLIRKIEDDPYFNGSEIERELLKLVQKLPERQRIVFNLRYFDEMKYEDMAEILGTSVGALKASYHHAYKKIKAEIEEKF